MPKYVAFLRAINVGGRVVKMEKLRALFESLGFVDVRTFIASGNVAFETTSDDAEALEGEIESLLKKELGYEVTTFLRTDSEVKSVASRKPFSEADLKQAGAFVVGFLYNPLGAKAKAALMKFKTEIDDFKAVGREVYWLCRHKQSESTFSNAVFEKKLSVRATFRGMNTMQRLAAWAFPE